MNTTEQKFNIVIPAELSKGDDGEWKVRGLASTASRDQQGEVILQNGIDTSYIKKGKAYFNWDHQRGPENVLGTIDTYQKSPQGLFVEGRLFKNHEKAKAVHGIMSSLGKSDRGRMGMSVEGSIVARAGDDGKIIKKCVIKAVALTMNPVNTDTFADLAKSMSAADEIDFDTDIAEDQVNPECEEVSFTPKQVEALIRKALTAGEGYTKVPTERSGGEALSQEDSDPKVKELEKPKAKKLKKLKKEVYKSNMVEILNNIQTLYPDHTRAQLWLALKERLNEKFPDLPSLTQE